MSNIEPSSQVKRITMPQLLAFTVHLFTATGSIFAFLSLTEASCKNWMVSFAWLGLALFVDGVDGPVARHLKVKYVLPNWSGELLDNIIDYVAYVLIPAFIVYNSGLLNHTLSYISALIIVISSAVYYADMGMKTKENFFKGFPVVWNMLVFSLFIIAPNQWVSFICIITSALVSFLPIYFLHPVRVERLRSINLPIFLLWCGLGVLALFYQLHPPLWLRIGVAVTGIYLYIIGGIMQFFPRLGLR
ncbi:phosphatidylcholine synthase [Bartonella sp. TP]|uniref:phosphatidylcholine synthase n=1 Tax=Bartonella sp. TP TaxID=3057550 RepID=UPI0025AF0FFB|nr:phosphatidylcholine/phosphatidylserine synthase [Bartonella sp. TP]MDN5248786.1 phosphatidylcholine/phosphatidylserine synthase [Alphaproteobacteria bacterium]WJW80050.1 phosphatidylcholine/phosphatidylserine synthase [Bartonella sp. TP]